MGEHLHDATHELRSALRTATYRSILAVTSVIASALFVLAGLSAWAIEYFFFYALFDYFDAASELAVSTSVKAVIAALAVLALHFAIERLSRSKHGGERLERRMAGWMIVLVLAFLLGAGMLFSAIIADQGLLSIGDPTSGLELPDGVKQLVDGSGSQWLTEVFKAYVLPVFPLAFGLSVIVMFLITAFVAHCCLSGILMSGRAIIWCRQTAKDIRQHVAMFFAADRSRRDHNRLIESNESPPTPDAVANTAQVAAATALGELQGILAARESEPELSQKLSAERRYQHVPHFWFQIPVAEMKQRLEALQTRTSIDRIQASIAGGQS